MSSPQPPKELHFLKISGNHQEFANKLRQLQIPDKHVKFGLARKIAAQWFRLAEEHLEDAQRAHRSKNRRTAYSRAYYAAYNASKAVRYMVKGVVSLHGDDHAKAPELPEHFVDVARWSKTITDLYADRLRADTTTGTIQTDFARPTKEAVALAKQFLNVARTFLTTECGVSHDL